ncbi:UNVERIFIED_CONTAM: hypothetical protein OHV15_13015 [Microbacterium sp. SLM126]
MARVSGRNSWIAAPVGIICAAIVGALVWMSLPMVPVTVAWTGEMLRNATSPQPAPSAGDTAARHALAGDALDCRALYSNSLWNEMTWQGRTILDQTFDAPPTEVPALGEVLAPQVRVSCAWSDREGRAVVSTLSVIAPEASGLGEAALRGQGFACAAGDGIVRCTRTSGETVEAHVLREGLWLATVERAWHPEDYGARLERSVFG